MLDFISAEQLAQSIHSIRRIDVNASCFLFRHFFLFFYIDLVLCIKTVIKIQESLNIFGGFVLKLKDTKQVICCSLENMGAHDIVDGNARLTLGLIWTIILR